jgi:hypothetical protein
MTISELKARVEDTGSLFFTRSTMKFFGDTMRNFSCGTKPIEIVDFYGAKRQVYAIWRKKATKIGTDRVYYFDAETFKRVSPQH